ncbi:NAD(P)H-hydrate dehydratase [Sphingomonas sp.]|uniref:NAD(P)H-hydrate dehydratase n=1 Tax=Sphingomonas sp. TaxID=28214 RepID=UPI003CC5BEAC
MDEIDAAWCAANPLPDPRGGKDARGQVLAIGGSSAVPGALRLTGEAALRAGAGKLRLATIATAALPLGIAFPEAAVLALPEAEGEIAATAGPALTKAAAHADALVFGPGMVDQAAAAELMRVVAAIDAPDACLVLDAAAVACAGPLDRLLEAWRGRLVLTPHAGEAASLLDCEMATIAADQAGAARAAAERFGAVVVLKGAETVVAAPEGVLLHYRGGGPGLGTAGSGDVLAGVVAGLLARGTAPLPAACWGVWMHGEAGRRLALDTAPVGFLARELLPLLPAFLPV